MIDIFMLYFDVRLVRVLELFRVVQWTVCLCFMHSSNCCFSHSDPRLQVCVMKAGIVRTLVDLSQMLVEKCETAHEVENIPDRGSVPYFIVNFHVGVGHCPTASCVEDPSSTRST